MSDEGVDVKADAGTFEAAIEFAVSVVEAAAEVGDISREARDEIIANLTYCTEEQSNG